MANKQALLEELQALQTELEHIGNEFNSDGNLDDQEQAALQELLANLDIVKKEANALKEPKAKDETTLVKDSAPDNGLKLEKKTDHAAKLDDEKVKKQAEEKAKAQEAADKIKSQSLDKNIQDAEDHFAKQKQNLDSINTQKQAIKNAEKDPNTKPEDLQKMRDELKKQTDAYVEENGGSNKMTKGGEGKIEGGWSANFGDDGLKLSAFITPSYEYEIKSPSYPVPGVPGLFFDVGFKFSMSMEGKLEALIDTPLLKKLGGGAAPMSFDEATSLFQKSINSPDLGGVTLSATLKPSISGSISLNLSLAKLIQVKVVGKLEASVELGVSTKLHSKDSYLFGSVSGGLEASASIEICPSPEAAAIIGAFSKDVLNSLSYTIPLGGKAELVKIASKKPTHAEPTQLFKDVEISKGQAIITLENALKEFYEKITKYVNMVGDAIEAVGDAIVEAAEEVVETTEEVIDGVKFMATKDLDRVSAQVYFNENRETYMFGEKVYFVAKINCWGKTGFIKGDYDITVDSQLYFDRTIVDYIKTKTLTADGSGENVKQEFYQTPGGTDGTRAIMWGLYKKYGRKTLEKTPFVLNTWIHVDKEKEVLNSLEFYVKFPENFDFEKFEIVK